MTHLIR